MDATAWAERVFGRANLGDVRRRDRLISFAAAQADSLGVSTLAASKGDAAASLGYYRWVSCRHFDDEMVAKSGYDATVRELPAQGDILVIQDMTTLTYPACLSPKLGPVGSAKTTKTQGIHVQSALAVDLETSETLGLVHQEGWIRPVGEKLSESKKLRDYDDKESSKWQRTDEVVRERLDSVWSRVITVGDRETDIGAYLVYKATERHRFVLRALHNRVVDGPDKRLRTAVQNAPLLGTLAMAVPQRGDRKARTAVLEVRATAVQLKSEDLPFGVRPTVNAVWVQEPHPPTGESGLDWLLYTTEPIDTLQAVERVLRCYRLRWRIEDFHKAWKSGGCDVEGLRQHSAATLKRVALVRAFIAVRILQLLDGREKHDQPCTSVLTDMQWQCLWLSVEKDKPLPKHAPSIAWACTALGKLGDWMPRKGARPGLEAMWLGWDRLDDRIQGVKLAARLRQNL